MTTTNNPKAFRTGCVLAAFTSVVLVLGLVLGSCGWAHAADDDKSSGDSLGDLFKKVKDLKVPDSVANLPGQLTELKDAYLKTAETVEKLRVEVDQLNEAVAALKTDNAELRQALSDKRVRDDLTKAAEVTSEELIEAFQGERAAADAQWKGRYVKVSGPVAAIESGTHDLYIYLRGTDADGALVRCEVVRDANFHVDVMADQGKVVSRNDRSIVLAVGQPVTIAGTCDGAELNVVVRNCKVEGLNVVKAQPKSEK